MHYLASVRRRLPFWLLLFGQSYVKLAFALPTATPTPVAQQDADTEAPAPTLATLYGFMDSVYHEEEALASGRPALAHLSKVFIAMAQTGSATLPMSTAAAELVEDVPLRESSLPSSTEDIVASAPPKQGPGLVMLTSQVLHPTSQPTPTSNTTQNASSTTAASHTSASSRVVVLGSVVGGILVVTLCLFFLLGPKKNRQALLCFRNKSGRRKGKQDKGISSDSFSSGSVLRKMNLRATIDVRKSGQSSMKEKGSITSSPSGLPPPSSKKASIASTEYLSCSPRESAISSGSESSTVKAASAASTPPARPPRPPTSDSPVLSDSVYLACSDKPYVIVAPQPLAETDLQSLPDTSRILTPEEFLAMHVPEILSGLPSLASKLDRGDSERRVQHARNRSSGHSRTRSEPAYNAEERHSKSSDGDGEEDEESIVRSSFVQRLIQHRRSRSASGWAYPDRLRSRKKKAEP